ncbi:MAG TPA: hypothetical protein VJQ77_06420 [Novosphingobium sp.]|nr:hypothetical protein [Novosphingobium sp.]
MVDIFALALSHGLLALAAIRLLPRPELDEEVGEPLRRSRFAARRAMKVPSGGGDGGSDA